MFAGFAHSVLILRAHSLLSSVNVCFCFLLYVLVPHLGYARSMTKEYRYLLLFLCFSAAFTLD